MNIAVNCRLLLKGKLEGIGWFMYENLKRITQDHPEHQFIFIFDRPYDPSFIFSDNVKAVVLSPPTRHPILWYLWFEWRLPTLLKKLQIDLFFSPDGYLSLRSKLPAVAAIHDINFAHRPKDLPFFTRHYYNYFFPKFAHSAAAVCTVSNYSKNDLSETYNIDKEKITVVYNGANTAYHPLPDDQKQQVKDQYTGGADYFLFIGSIHPRKNLDNLIAAYQLFIRNTGSTIRLVVVGTQMWKNGNQESFNLGSACTAPGGPGKAQAAPKSQSQPNSDSNSKPNSASPIFLGRLGPEELVNVLGSALALTFVPWFEGFGIPVLEAMYAGIPVLTSTETSLPEVGGDAVLYAHPGDINQMAVQMKLLANQANIREELIKKGNRQKEKFSWDQTATKVWECLDAVLQQNKTPDHG